MIARLEITGFKSLREVSLELGRVNVFVGANSSGKTNILEAVGVLGAAAFGRIDDAALLFRGVRPGVPALYKSSFRDTETQRWIKLEAEWLNDTGSATYRVQLNNPINEPRPNWFYTTEWLEEDGARIVGASPRTQEARDPAAGLAALKLVTMEETAPASRLIRALQDYCVYSPTTAALRGLVQDQLPREPLGLSGGRLPEAIAELLELRWQNGGDFYKAVVQEVFGLIDWVDMYKIRIRRRGEQPLSPSVSSGPYVLEFRDRFMRPSRNILTAYDASEGALIVLMAAVLAAHPDMPAVFAVDNFLQCLNPRLARDLMRVLCQWVSAAPEPRQMLLTTHNPLVLDGLDLSDPHTRLFAVDRTRRGYTSVNRVELDPDLITRAGEGWSLSRLWISGQIGGVPNI